VIILGTISLLINSSLVALSGTLLRFTEVTQSCIQIFAKPIIGESICADFGAIFEAAKTACYRRLWVSVSLAPSPINLLVVWTAKR